MKKLAVLIVMALMATGAFAQSSGFGTPTFNCAVNDTYQDMSFLGVSWKCGPSANSWAPTPAFQPWAGSPSGSKSLSCQPGVGDGLNAIAAGTYLQTTCRNETGGTWTITAIRCVTDSGSSTCNATNGAGTGLLTGAVTGTTTYANGTQSGTTTIAAGDFLKITFVADGTTKQIGIDVAGTY